MGQLEQKIVGVSTKKCHKLNNIQWVKITTRYWEWHGELVMMKSRKHTENQLSNIILTKIRHLEQRRSLKRLERLMMFCQTPKRSKSMISMVRRDSGGMGGGSSGAGGMPNFGNGQGYSYSYHGDPRATFSQFFGGSNPFASFFSASPGGMGGGLGGTEGIGNRGGAQFGRPNSFNYGSGPGPSKQARVQDKTIEKEVQVILEEIAKGAEKKMKISRRIQHDDGRITNEEKVLKINIKPGWKAGTKVTFNQEGDKVPGKIPADIAFIIRDKPHPIFSRDGANLKYTYKIPLREALCGTLVQVPTL